MCMRKHSSELCYGVAHTTAMWENEQGDEYNEDDNDNNDDNRCHLFCAMRCLIKCGRHACSIPPDDKDTKEPPHKRCSPLKIFVSCSTFIYINNSPTQKQIRRDSDIYMWQWILGHLNSIGIFWGDRKISSGLSFYSVICFAFSVSLPLSFLLETVSFSRFL